MKSRAFMKMTFSAAFLVTTLCLCCLTGCGDDSSSPNPNPNNPNNPNPTIPLTPPQSVQVTGIDGGVFVRWTKLSDAQGVSATYEIWGGETDNSAAATKLADLPECSGLLCEARIDNHNLRNGVVYYVWVKALYGSLGDSGFSPSFMGMPVPTPETPTGLTVISGDNLLEVRWNAPQYASSYEVLYRNNNPSGTNAPPTNGFYHTVTVTNPAIVIANFDGNPLVSGNPYYIWVRAVNTDGASPYTMQATGVPARAASAPSAPGYITVEPGNKRLSLTWDSVTRATKYNIYTNTVDNFATASKYGEVPHNIPRVNAGIVDLTNGDAYYVWVTAENSRGVSGRSPAGSGIPEAKDIPIDYNNYNFILGEAGGDFIFAETLPLAPFSSRSNGGIQDRLVRGKETPLSNLFTDGAAWYAREVMNEEFDFLFLNGGFIDNAIPRGTISLGTLAAATEPTSRYEDNFTFLTLKGSDVIELFNEAAEEIPHTGAGTGGTGPWAMVSEEVSYTIMYNELPAGTPLNLDPKFSGTEAELYQYGWIKPGSLKINGLDVDPNKDYRVATTSYLAGGTGGYMTFPIAGRNIKETTTLFWHGVAEYIYERGIVTPTLPINNDGCRVTIEGGVFLGDLNKNICNFDYHRP